MLDTKHPRLAFFIEYVFFYRNAFCFGIARLVRYRFFNSGAARIVPSVLVTGKSEERLYGVGLRRGGITRRQDGGRGKDRDDGRGRNAPGKAAGEAEK